MRVERRRQTQGLGTPRPRAVSAQDQGGDEQEDLVDGPAIQEASAEPRAGLDEEIDQPFPGGSAGKSMEIDATSRIRQVPDLPPSPLEFLAAAWTW